jgi:hypothetical protein
MLLPSVGAVVAGGAAGMVLGLSRRRERRPAHG